MMLSTSDGDPVTNFTFGGTESIVVPLEFSNLGTTLDYIHVPGSKALDESDQCSADGDALGRGLQIKFYPFVLPGGIYYLRQKKKRIALEES